MSQLCIFLGLVSIAFTAADLGNNPAGQHGLAFLGICATIGFFITSYILEQDS